MRYSPENPLIHLLNWAFVGISLFFEGVADTAEAVIRAIKKGYTEYSFVVHFVLVTFYIFNLQDIFVP